jgi:hypothetical protein
MPTKAFVIAMAADIARSDYAKPTLIRSRSREWLIACRWGPDGEYLSIATAGAIQDPPGLLAPAAISPIHSMVGVLVSESETEAASTFLLVRQLPMPIELAGTFFPADGYVLLQQRDDIRLVSRTRYSHRWQGNSQGYSGSGAVFGGSNGVAHRSYAARLDRRVLSRQQADGKSRHARHRPIARRAARVRKEPPPGGWFPV